MSITKKWKRIITFTGVLALVIVAVPLAVKAATIVAVAFEPEAGSVASCSTVVSDSSASNGKAVTYGTCAATTPPVVVPPATTGLGANIPISYSLSSLSGTVYYVSPSGSDSNSGSASSPYATLSKAVSTAAAGSSIVIRGGTYRGQAVAAVNKTLHIAAYPGETPIFDGTQIVSSGWTTSGSNSYRSYTPLAATVGSGIQFTTGQNLTGTGVGKYPDQAWVGSTELQQVMTLAEVTSGKFYVDQTNKRMYLSNTDISKGNIGISQLQQFAKVTGSNVTIEGVTIQRYSDLANTNGVLTITGSGFNMKNTVISDASFFTMTLSGGGGILKSAIFDHITIQGSNFMGIEATYVDGLVVKNSKLDGANSFGEFTSSPVSGAIKTSKTHDDIIMNNEIANNKSHGIWFDQSNENVTVAGNRITGNTGDAVFFEISDNLWLINNYIDARNAQQGLKAAGSSGIHAINNTFIGGADNIGIYTDSRSIPGCVANGCSAIQYQSDRDTIRTRPSTLDWMPRVDMFINNVFAYPTGSSYCGTVDNICMTIANGSASQPMSAIIHKADTARGIPQTVIDGNVYAPASSGILWRAGNVSYSTPSAITSAMASISGISGIDANSKYGSSWVQTNGQPTAALSAVHSSAVAIPNNASITPYISAGTKHYGYTGF